ncbi:hypothetical protein E2C01_034353 [Portunus trituberculatus]|uniref:Uncharacterized protein n=1 Tax=Portunus trituberculatus TaxID=210409 RepID=A0A5B7F5B7_PORTR|nr:hypothetical protein [Portunus trituberculatus]
MWPRPPVRLLLVPFILNVIRLVRDRLLKKTHFVNILESRECLRTCRYVSRSDLITLSKAAALTVAMICCLHVSWSSTVTPKQLGRPNHLEGMRAQGELATGDCR